jgi:hypothetical protein
MRPPTTTQDTKKMNRSPSILCKQHGLKSFSQVSELTGIDLSTLKRWHKDKEKLFDIVILGCVKKAGQLEEVQNQNEVEE